MFGFSFLIVLLTDQVTKALAVQAGIATINPGISFAWFQQVPAPVITITICFFALWLAFRFYHQWKRHSVMAGIFWGGVVSNIMDRLVLGGVVDWLRVPVMAIKNNLADWAIGVATIVLLGRVIKERYGHRHRI